MKTRMPRAPAGRVAGLLAAALLLGAYGPTAHAQEGTPPEGGQAIAAPATPEGTGATTAPTAGTTATGTTGTAATAQGQDVDISARIPTRAKTGQFWHLLAIYELHFNLVSDAYSANDVYSWYLLQAKFDVTKNNQLGVRFDMLQRYVADEGENGLFPSDLRFYYWRKFALPIPKFPIPGVASLYLTAPTSRESRSRGYVTRPTVTLSLAPSYGPLTLIVTGIYRYSFAKDAESAERSAPNERQSAGIQGQLIYQPVDWFSPSFLWQSWWAEPYPDREGHDQGWRGSTYYFEVALTFTLPMPKPWPGVDLSLAYAQGAPMLAGGIYRFAFAKRDQSELYFGLNLTY
mgnify:CR=1 FL=1